jgi:glycosyltransferase involved in cell wall biosynthesis
MLTRHLQYVPSTLAAAIYKDLMNNHIITRQIAQSPGIYVGRELVIRFVPPRAIRNESAIPTGRTVLAGADFHLQMQIRTRSGTLSPFVLTETEALPAFGESPALHFVRYGSGQTFAFEKAKPLLVCLSHVSAWPPRAGNEYRIHRLLMWLTSCGWDILFLLCPPVGDEKSDSEIAALARGCPNFMYVNRDGLVHYQTIREDVAACARAMDGRKVNNYSEILGEDKNTNPVFRLNHTIRRFSPDVLVELLVGFSALLHPRVLIVNYVFMTRGLPALAKGILKIVDTHDVFSTKYTKVSTFGIEDGLAMTPAEEGHLISRANVVLAIQPEERDILRRISPQSTIITVGVDMPRVEDIEKPSLDKIVLLVASNNPMNSMGLKDFLRFSWPRVLATYPDAKLHIVGSVGGGLRFDEPGVKNLGRIDDLKSAYRAAHLVINPAVAGTGLKIKTLEALAHLRPIVVWPSGVDGVPTDLRDLCECVTDWFEFTRSVVRLLDSNEAVNKIMAARHRIAELLDPDAVYAELNEVLKERLGVEWGQTL